VDVVFTEASAGTKHFNKLVKFPRHKQVAMAILLWIGDAEVVNLQSFAFDVAFRSGLIRLKLIFGVESIRHPLMFDHWANGHDSADKNILTPHNIHLSAPSRLNQSHKIQDDQWQVN